MHDALGYARYTPDTLVEDVEDHHPPIPRPRVATEDLTMHVYTMGKWHRRTPDLQLTPCEKPIAGQFCPVRREELVGDLCTDGCFTPFELRTAATNNAKGYEP